MSSMRLRKISGFTLIELLVVIAIIGILAAMVFPVFARARESARKAVCLSNMKNLALAINMYLSDYNDTFWPFDTDTTDSYLLIGPLRLGGPGMYGRLAAIHGMIAASSGTVLWKIITGETAEEACVNGKAAITQYLAGNTQSGDAYVHTSGSWPAGRAHTSYPRTRAMWICVLLKASTQWAYESITIQSHDAGRWR